MFNAACPPPPCTPFPCCTAKCSSVCGFCLLLLFLNYRATLKFIYYARAVVALFLAGFWYFFFRFSLFCCWYFWSFLMFSTEKLHALSILFWLIARVARGVCVICAVARPVCIAHTHSCAAEKRENSHWLNKQIFSQTPLCIPFSLSPASHGGISRLYSIYMFFFRAAKNVGYFSCSSEN